MTTKILDVSDLNNEMLERAYVVGDEAAQAKVEAAITLVREAGHALAGGSLVAFPTETVYGLGADAFNEDAVGRVYEAKGRPSDNPMICHIGRASDIGELSTMLNPKMIRLMDNFWPGPLTMIVTKRDDVPAVTTGGLDTVGVRLPDNPVAIELIRAAGCPIAAPSANLSGSPSPTDPKHVIEDLDGKVDYILVGNKSDVGIESTVLDMTVTPPMILRPGVLTAEMLGAAVGEEVAYDAHLLYNDKEHASDANGEIIAPKAPGMKYKHYAPNAQMIVVEGHRDKVKTEIERLKSLNEQLGQKVGVLLFEEDEYIRAAQEFYSRLRALDEDGGDLIIAGALSYKDGVGFAVMNRMMKSAGYNVVKV
ncbi:MAG: threonylcarbamoyl-AMP synthase [Clostridiales Family XIII bacterium]|jgi:L-threonylcarbamoyladenylate synthase|nr:threonylcarbamoyl-AMP synthase [Clostridiales Family XIII bacterium]